MRKRIQIRINAIIYELREVNSQPLPVIPDADVPSGLYLIGNLLFR